MLGESLVQFSLCVHVLTHEIKDISFFMLKKLKVIALNHYFSFFSPHPLSLRQVHAVLVCSALNRKNWIRKERNVGQSPDSNEPGA